MRRALGLDGERPPSHQSAPPRPAFPRSVESHAPARHRHRFVNDGDVPVVVVHSRPDQPAPARPDRSAAQLGEERTARERVERALAAANARIRELETQVVHVSLARDEALSALREAQEQLVVARMPPPAPARPAQADAPTQPPVRRRGRPPKVKTDRPAPPAKSRGKAQQPVKWWVKGWRDAMAD